MAEEADTGSPDSKKSEQVDKNQPKAGRAVSSAETARFADEREKIEELLQLDLEPVTKADVSASTIVKMMGVASATELKLVEGKLDLLAGRLGNFSIRLERVLNQLNHIPSAGDFERLEGQLTTIRSMLKELTHSHKGENGKEERETKEKLQAYLQNTQSNTDSGKIVAAKGDVSEDALSSTEGESSTVSDSTDAKDQKSDS